MNERAQAVYFKHLPTIHAGISINYRRYKLKKMRCSLLVLRSFQSFASSIFLQVLVSLFQIEKRVGDRLQKWQEDVDKELEQQREAAKFHARPATILVSLLDCNGFRFSITF
jgi:hypothetical protein